MRSNCPMTGKINKKSSKSTTSSDFFSFAQEEVGPNKHIDDKIKVSMLCLLGPPRFVGFFNSRPYTFKETGVFSFSPKT